MKYTSAVFVLFTALLSAAARDRVAYLSDLEGLADTNYVNHVVSGEGFATTGQLSAVSSRLAALEDVAVTNETDPHAVVANGQLTVKGFAVQTNGNYALSSEIPASTSQLENDSGFITLSDLSPYATSASIPNVVSNVVTKEYVEDLGISGGSVTNEVDPTVVLNDGQLTVKGFVVQTNGNYALESEIPTRVTDLMDADDYPTIEDVTDIVDDAISSVDFQETISNEIERADIPGRVDTIVSNSVDEVISELDVEQRVLDVIDGTVSNKVSEAVGEVDFGTIATNAVNDVDIPGKVDSAITAADIGQQVSDAVSEAVQTNAQAVATIVSNTVDQAYIQYYGGDLATQIEDYVYEYYVEKDSLTNEVRGIVSDNYLEALGFVKKVDVGAYSRLQSLPVQELTVSNNVYAMADRAINMLTVYPGTFSLGETNLYSQFSPGFVGNIISVTNEWNGNSGLYFCPGPFLPSNVDLYGVVIPPDVSEIPSNHRLSLKIPSAAKVFQVNGDYAWYTTKDPNDADWQVWFAVVTNVTANLFGETLYSTNKLGFYLQYSTDGSDWDYVRGVPEDFPYDKYDYQLYIPQDSITLETPYNHLDLTLGSTNVIATLNQINDMYVSKFVLNDGTHSVPDLDDIGNGSGLSNDYVWQLDMDFTAYATNIVGLASEIAAPSGETTNMFSCLMVDNKTGYDAYIPVSGLGVDPLFSGCTYADGHIGLPAGLSVLLFEGTSLGSVAVSVFSQNMVIGSDSGDSTDDSSEDLAFMQDVVVNGDLTVSGKVHVLGDLQVDGKLYINGKDALQVMTNIVDNVVE